MKNHWKFPSNFFCMSTVMSDRNLSGLSGTTRKDPSTTGKYREVAIADLFVWKSHSRMFHSYGDVIIAGLELQMFTYARHSWPLSIEGSLACHTYCETGHPFIIVIFEDPWHSHLLPSVLSYDESEKSKFSVCRQQPTLHVNMMLKRKILPL